MLAPLFHLRESRTWVRTATHTAIRDDEPDFARFVASGDGDVQRVIRIWFAERLGGQECLRAYLGSFTISAAGPSMRDLRRVFRRAEWATRAPEHQGRPLRSTLAGWIRRRVREAAGEVLAP